MSKKLAFTVFALLAVSSPAWAQNAVCVEPAMPSAVVDGNTATREQIVAAAAAARDFVAKSDTYQQCIADDLAAKKAAAEKAGTPFDGQLQEVAQAKVAVNQQAKDKFVADTNVQIGLYKQKASTAAK
jgi:hypothetical protein